MKRKDWKIKNLKKDIFGKSFLKTKRFKGRYFFLRKLFLRKNKYLIKKNLFFNYFFFKKLLNDSKTKKQLYLSNIFFKTKLIKTPFFPEYSLNKNIFNKKNKFNSLLQKNNLKIIFLPNKYRENNYGLNYYFIDNNNKNNLLELSKDVLDENNFNLIHFKEIKKLDEFCFSFFINYNFHNLCLLEIYKILIILYIKN